jgi:hypothetical protein
VSTSRSWGSLIEDRWEQWAIGGSCPRRPVVHRKGGVGGGGDRGFGARQGEKRWKWIKYELLVLLSRRGREIEQAGVWNTAAAMWWPADGSGGRGACEIGQQGRARVAGDVQATRGEGGSRRWSGSGLHSGGGEVLCTSGSEGQGSRGVPEEEERRGFEGSLWKYQKYKGPYYKVKFPIDLKP